MCGRFTLSNRKLIKAKYGLSWQPSYNIAPSHNVLASTGNNILFTKPWGFSPAWYQSGKSLINARIESLNFKPSYKNVMRCVVLADGWYEWKQKDEFKVPHFHHLKGDLFFFGGVFGGYRGKVGCAIVTTDAVESLKNIHERMPLIISRQHFQGWLNGDDIDYVDTFSSKAIINHPVSTHVNNPLNDDPKCVFPNS